jgi:hypothetical protein
MRGSCAPGCAVAVKSALIDETKAHNQDDGVKNVGGDYFVGHFLT